MLCVFFLYHTYYKASPKGPLDNKSPSKVYLGFVEKDLLGEIEGFIDKSRKLNTAIIKAGCDVISWDLGGGMNNIPRIKRNRTLAQPAIDDLSPEKREELLKLLED